MRTTILLVGFIIAMLLFVPNDVRAVGSCNNNTLCEGFEDASCRDCQCTSGVVCGSLCYNNLQKTACNNGTLISTAPEFKDKFCLSLNTCPKDLACIVPGWCKIGPPLVVQFDFPKRIALNEWIDGIVTIMNTGTRALNGRLQWEISDLDVRTRDGKNPRDIYPQVVLEPNRSLQMPLRIQGTRVSDRVDNNKLMTSYLNIVVFLPGFGEGMTTFQYNPYVIDAKSAQTCGGYLWNVAGVCVGNIFFPGGDCKFGKGCIGRMSGWNSAYTDVIKAKGTKKVQVIALDIPRGDRARVTAARVRSLFKEVGDWYSKEAKRIAKKPMVKFSARFEGQYTLKLKNYTFDGVRNLRTYLAKKTRRSFPKSDILIVVVPTLPKFDLGDAAGLVYGDGIIFVGLGLHGYESGFNAETIAHELAHLFGCKDLYTQRYLCSYQWRSSLLCAATWIPSEFGSAPEIGTRDTFQRRTLGNCAAEMGWGDQDNDGILDLDDPAINAIAPDGFPGILINNFQAEKDVKELVFANRQNFMSSGSLVLRGTVAEQGTNEPVAAQVQFTWSERDLNSGALATREEPCLTEGARFVCIVYSGLNEPQTIMVRAFVDRFQAEERYLFVP
ncbi:hypothetical protein HY624_00445 [Candidatus Uhrbacteria bacterium]|nr:hypothetical protein [Candidatus Uhrbacteria bacterium]